MLFVTHGLRRRQVGTGFVLKCPEIASGSDVKCEGADVEVKDGRCVAKAPATPPGPTLEEIASLFATKEQVQAVETAQAQLVTQQELNDALEDTVHEVKQHAEETMQFGVENATGEADAQFEEVRADFAEFSSNEFQAGFWDYSFTGSASGNQAFSYWFSIDHGGQGASGDSTHCGNWLLTVKTGGGHCGGGCHSNREVQEFMWNGYCDSWTIKDERWSTGNPTSGSFSVDRVPDGHNGHNKICHTFKVTHNAGSAPYGGPCVPRPAPPLKPCRVRPRAPRYWVEIHSSKPLRALKTHPWGSCSFNGVPSGGVSDKSHETCAASTNCPKHLCPPGSCRSKAGGSWGKAGCFSDNTLRAEQPDCDCDMR